jgi:uncharacterized membrane protein
MYLLLKLLHVLGVIAFLGNITTGLFWHRHAWRMGDPRVLAHTMSGIIRADRLFTTPGVLVILLSGIAAAHIGGIPILKTGWVLWTLVLFFGSGAIFGMRVVPLQRQMLAVAAAQDSFDAQRYARLTRQWQTWGAIAVLLPLVGVVLMVLKPVH